MQSSDAGLSTTPGLVPSEAFSSKAAPLSLRAPDISNKNDPQCLQCVYGHIANLTYVQIAEETGLCRQTVAKIIGQPWAQAVIAKESKRLAKPILEGLGAVARRALQVLEEIMEDSKARSADRISACIQLLDRIAGKAISRSEVEVTHKKPDDIAAIEKELKEIHNEIANRTGIKNADAILINDR